MHKRIPLIAALLITSSSFAKTPVVCDNHYALCSAAACKAIPSSKNRALCKCSIWQGKNIGYSSCAKRKSGKPHRNLISTFSFGGGHYKAQVCPAGQAWTSCLDMPCKQSAKNPRHAFCNCKIIHSGKYVTFAGGCKKSQCSKAMWSGATISGNKKLTETLATHLSQKPKPFMCESK